MLTGVAHASVIRLLRSPCLHEANTVGPWFTSLATLFTSSDLFGTVNVLA